MERPNLILSSKNLRSGLRWLAAVFFILAGINLFLHPAFYEKIMPPGFPAPKFLIFVSGLAEVAGGFGLLIHPLRRAAGWGLIALLVAVFPVNIYMALYPGHFEIAPWILWARLPLQAIFVAWVWWISLARSPASGVFLENAPGQ